MSTSEQNVCNLLRQTWMSLITLLENLQDIPKELLDRIRTLLNRLKNILLDSIRQHLEMIVDYIKRALALQAIDNNLARQSFCEVMYSCLPAINKLHEYGILPDAMFNKIFGEQLITTPDLAEYGIPGMTFRSNFEAFEYIACRLSLTSLLDSFMNSMIEKLFDYLSQFEKYYSLDYWLQNTFIGRQILTLIKLYESAFEYILKIINEELDPFMDCTFGLCDFGISTQNFMDDFSRRYKLERDQANIGNAIRGPWKVSRNKLFEEYDSYLKDSAGIIKKITKEADTVKNNMQNMQSTSSRNSTAYFSEDSSNYRRSVVTEVV